MGVWGREGKEGGRSLFILSRPLVVCSISSLRQYLEVGESMTHVSPKLDNPIVISRKNSAPAALRSSAFRRSGRTDEDNPPLVSATDQCGWWEINGLCANILFLRRIDLICLFCQLFRDVHAVKSHTQVLGWAFFRTRSTWWAGVINWILMCRVGRNPKNDWGWTGGGRWLSFQPNRPMIEPQYQLVHCIRPGFVIDGPPLVAWVSKW